jgi:hypothetical protein
MPTERDLFLWQSKTAIVRPQRASTDLLGEIRAVDFDPDARALFGLFGRICLVTRAFFFALVLPSAFFFVAIGRAPK